jgi:hypothetical protein
MQLANGVYCLRYGKRVRIGLPEIHKEMLSKINDVQGFAEKYKLKEYIYIRTQYKRIFTNLIDFLLLLYLY